MGSFLTTDSNKVQFQNILIKYIIVFFCESMISSVVRTITTNKYKDNSQIHIKRPLILTNNTWCNQTGIVLISRIILVIVKMKA